MKLVIVESPTKAKTLAKFLGKEYKIEASMGHIRDLPSNKINVDVDNGFVPFYAVDDRKKKVVSLLKKLAKTSEKVILATDSDREGEAIAYHVEYLLGGKEGEFERIVFHEITKKAIEEALKNPGKVNIQLFEAQQARRILDRLVGYKLSPILWKKVRRGLSAGRVQSVAMRLIVEREREIEAFKADEYWDINVEVKKQAEEKFTVKLAKIDGKKAKVENGKEAKKIEDDLKKAEYKVGEVKARLVKQYPVPPFITSTLQRTAGQRFGWSAKKVMSTAQKLYESGLITYHRTDSFNMAKEAIGKVRGYIKEQYGEKYLPEKANYYKSRSKMVQGAHEAIRPTKMGKIDSGLGQNWDKLYRLIWQRFTACQMMPAEFEKTRVNVEAVPPSGEAGNYELRAEGQRLVFDGWLKVNEKLVLKNQSLQQLPKLDQGDLLELIKVLTEQKFTQPSARYTEASLIKVLEEKGIGRPSTYAPILSTIQGRQYVEKVERKLKPTSVGMTVTDFLTKHFSVVMDYDFTAGVEDDLDNVAKGEKKWVKILEDFYGPFDKKVADVTENVKRVKIEVEKTGERCGECKKGDIVIRVGRFGKFLSCSRFPECKYTGNYKEVVEGVKCGDCDGEVVIKKTRKGRQFYGCGNYPKCKWASWNKPK